MSNYTRFTGVSLRVDRYAGSPEININHGSLIDALFQCYGGEVSAEVIAIGGAPRVITLLHTQGDEGSHWMAQHTDTTEIDASTLYIATVTAEDETRHGVLELIRAGIIEANRRAGNAVVSRKK